MTIQKYSKAGKDAYRYVTWYVDEDGSRKQKKASGFPSKKKAVDACKTFCKKYENNVCKPKKCSKDLFSVLYKEYEKEHINRLKPSTADLNKRLFRIHILPYFGNMYMAEITPKVVNSFIKKMERSVSDKTGRHFSEDYRKDVLSQAKGFIRYCWDNHLGNMDRLPFNRETKVTIHKKSKKDFWTVEEFSQFANYWKLKDERKYALFYVLYYTGLRKGELLGLQKQDFDLEKGELKIAREYQEVSGKMIIQDGTLKTISSYRTVPLVDRVVEVMKEYFDHYQFADTDRVFPYKYGRINDWLDVGISETEVKRITPHEFRHSFATLLNKLQSDPKTAQTVLGHSNIKTTLEIYTHTTDEKILDVKEKLNSVAV